MSRQGADLFDAYSTFKKLNRSQQREQRFRHQSQSHSLFPLFSPVRFSFRHLRSSISLELAGDRTQGFQIGRRQFDGIGQIGHQRIG